jgi:hypothetical protein
MVCEVMLEEDEPNRERPTPESPEPVTTASLDRLGLRGVCLNTSILTRTIGTPDGRFN